MSVTSLPALSSPHHPQPITPDERCLLYVRYDGPVPPQALDDLRRNPPAPFDLARLTHTELASWQALAWRNLKSEQQRLVDLRHNSHRSDADSRSQQRSSIRWALAACIKLRGVWQTFAHESIRRVKRSPLHTHMRTLHCLNRALGVGSFPTL